MLLLAAVVFTPVTASAQATLSEATIQNLLNQIAVLQQQIRDLTAQQQLVQSSYVNVLKLTQKLSVGMSSEEVKILQELLATDPEIYPEGYITGYYGPLTAKALGKFKKKFVETTEVNDDDSDDDSDDNDAEESDDDSDDDEDDDSDDDDDSLDDKTIKKINELLLHGAGKSGKIPHGFLRAPGIWKKLGGVYPTIPTTTPATTTPTGDITAPVLSRIDTDDIKENEAKVTWQTNEKSTSQVWWSFVNPPVTNASTTRTIKNSKMVTSHSVKINGLAASTTYYYIIGSTDAAGNAATSPVKSFQTDEEDED